MYPLVIPVLPLLIFPLFSTSLTIPLLITPSRVHHNITVPSLGALKVNCYIQPLPPTKRLPRAEISDCYFALQGVLLGDKVMAPMHFTENDKGGFKVPFAWGHDSCQIIINNLTPHAEATFPIVLIAHLAAEIAEACIVQTPANLGGDIKIGDHDQFEVILAGTGVRNGRLDVVDGNSNTDVVAVERRMLTSAVGTSW